MMLKRKAEAQGELSLYRLILHSFEKQMEVSGLVPISFGDEDDDEV